MSHYSSTIGATLVTEGLWRKFHQHTTEMIVTKSGRKIFPKLEYKLHGMDPNESYALMLHIERADDMRYKFSAGDWSTNGKGEPPTPSRGVPHHDLTIDTGRGWMSKTVAFDRVKVTNNQQDTDTFHVRIFAIFRKELLGNSCFLKSLGTIFGYSSIDAQIRSGPVRLPNARYDNVVEPEHASIRPVLFGCSHKSLVVNSSAEMTTIALSRFNFTEFIAVTAYQNNEVTQLKISHNPFAKGFREGSERDRKRASTSPLFSEPSPKRISPTAASDVKVKCEPSFGSAFLFPWTAPVADSNSPRSNENRPPAMPWYNYYQHPFYSPLPYYYPCMPNYYPTTTPEC
ncbi:unnamed protein product [Haemonchus placei]|uniref:T-box domain-containing protein n=1 Tax=Haemonchus placei TaxID=6290 RepID=A0A0N4W0Q5_HAEPC|nr:unnamed protein product [Haemonchus placei]